VIRKELGRRIKRLIPAVKNQKRVAAVSIMPSSAGSLTGKNDF